MHKWLQNAVVYQIYPTSFYDSNGDGVGDLPGITQKLSYVKELGADIVWLNPIYKSPFRDGGYDISDYRQIDECFGTLADFQQMLQRAHSLGLKVCMDLVIGHTSWDHPWFVQSAQKEKNAYSDYYIWTDSIFESYKDKTVAGLYERNGCFFINYYACQPALNFGFNDTAVSQSAPEDAYEVTGGRWMRHYTDPDLAPLRQELYDIVAYWLDMGVDGFRVDMANSLVKGCKYDSDKDEDIAGLIWFWKEFFGYVRSRYPESFFISEWVYPKNAVGKCGFDVDIIAHDEPSWNSLFRCEKGTNLLSAFETGHNYFSADGKGSAEAFLKFQQETNAFIGKNGYFTAPTGSHDEIRLATGKTEPELKTVFAFLLTAKQVPFLYYGDEIGITHNFGVSRDGGFVRTGARTPMQWDESKNRGFSQHTAPYLPADNREDCSVEAQSAREDSLLNTVKALLKLRKAHTCLGAGGDFKVVECCNGGYPLIYDRENTEETVRVVINPGSRGFSRAVPECEPLLLENACINEGKLTVSGTGFALLKLK